MSVAPTPEQLPDARRPLCLGGGCKESVWVITTDKLGPKLTLNMDTPDHGLIQPKYSMPYNEYVEALESTQPYWRLIIDGK